MASSEIRFKLLELVHNHALSPEAVTERVEKYEKFLDAVSDDSAPTKAAKKRGEPLK